MFTLLALSLPISLTVFGVVAALVVGYEMFCGGPIPREPATDQLVLVSRRLHECSAIEMQSSSLAP